MIIEVENSLCSDDGRTFGDETGRRSGSASGYENGDMYVFENASGSGDETGKGGGFGDRFSVVFGFGSVTGDGK